jgi:hypothetical protein
LHRGLGGKDSHVNAVGFHYEPLHRIHLPAAQPSAALLRVAGEDLRYAVAVRELENACDRIVASQDLNVGVSGVSGGQILFNDALIGGAEDALLDVNRLQIAMKQVCLAAPAADHQRCIRARRKAH